MDQIVNLALGLWALFVALVALFALFGVVAVALLLAELFEKGVTPPGIHGEDAAV